MNPDDMDPTEEDLSDQLFADFLNDVEAELETVTEADHQSALEQILDEAGYHRDADTGEVSKITQDVIHVTDAELPPVEDACVQAALDAPDDTLLMRMLVDVEHKQLQDVRREIDELQSRRTQAQAEAEAFEKRATRARKMARAARELADVAWEEAHQATKEAAKTVAQAEADAEAYQDAAITEAAKIVADARAKAEILRFSAAQWADAIVAEAAQALPEAHPVTSETEPRDPHDLGLSELQQQRLAIAGGASTGSRFDDTSREDHVHLHGLGMRAEPFADPPPDRDLNPGLSPEIVDVEGGGPLQEVRRYNTRLLRNMDGLPQGCLTELDLGDPHNGMRMVIVHTGSLDLSDLQAALWQTEERRTINIPLEDDLLFQGTAGDRSSSADGLLRPPPASVEDVGGRRLRTALGAGMIGATASLLSSIGGVLVGAIVVIVALLAITLIIQWPRIQTSHWYSSYAYRAGIPGQSTAERSIFL